MRHKRGRKRLRLNKVKLMRTAIFLAASMYVLGVLFFQQIDSNANARRIEAISTQVEVEQEKHEELLRLREYSKTPEYIEKVARDRGLVRPDEIVFIDPSSR